MHAVGHGNHARRQPGLLLLHRDKHMRRIHVRRALQLPLRQALVLVLHLHHLLLLLLLQKVLLLWRQLELLRL